MKKDAQVFLNPKTIAFTIGGAILSYFIFNSLEATVIGGLIGFVLSFIL